MPGFYPPPRGASNHRNHGWTTVVGHAIAASSGRLPLLSTTGQDIGMVIPATEAAIRAAAFAWIEGVTLGGTVPVSRERLANDFIWNGERFPLVDRGRGIRRPAGWRAALSITTSAPKTGRSRPYADDLGPDGLHRYKLRSDARGAIENDGLRTAMRDAVPLIWLYGLEAGVFQAIYPVWLTAEEADQFVVALTELQRSIRPRSPMEEALRRYLMVETKRRLHQPVFSSQVMLAYSTRCAVCALGHRELLDAAHIIPDSSPHGEPIVPNGLALCKIHHAAYDRNILGIRPDYVIEVHHRLLEEIDGPMLRHGLQEHHRRPLLHVPSRRADKPDPARLEERFEQFAAA